MAATIIALAVILAVVSGVLVWREATRRMRVRTLYLTPLTLFRRELSLAGISTIVAVVIWASYMPSSVRFAALALFPTFLYLFLMLKTEDEED